MVSTVSRDPIWYVACFIITLKWNFAQPVNSRDPIWYVACFIIILKWNFAQPVSPRDPKWYVSMASMISNHNECCFNPPYRVFRACTEALRIRESIEIPYCRCHVSQ